MLLYFVKFSVLAQIGGQNSFEFMRLPNHARAAGMGGVNITAGGGDVNMFFQNPALLTETSERSGSFNYSPFFANIGYTSVAYAHRFQKAGRLGFGLQYIGYGEMELTDPSGLASGTFRAGDLALSLAKNVKMENFYFGATLKFLRSQIESYHSNALVFDIGGLFKHPVEDLTIGLTLKNIGLVFNRFVPERPVNLPFDAQLGISYKPKYMPVRFSLTAHHLYTFDIVYLDPSLQTTLDPLGNPVTEKKKFFDKLARHFVLGAELLISKNFHLRAGYNHLISRELRVEGAGGLVGFSYGLMFKVKAFEFALSNFTYHRAGGRFFLSLVTRFDTLLKKRSKAQEQL